MSPVDLERLLARFAPDRRTFLKTLVLGTAYASPVIASFSMDALGVSSAAAASNLCSSNLVSNTSDVVVSKTASPDPVTAGNQLTYTVTVYNCGPAAATKVQFTDQLPGGAAFVSAAQTGGTTPFVLVTPPVGAEGASVHGAASASMPAGDSAVFTIVVQVNP